MGKPAKAQKNRTRMIVDVPRDVQMAIKLRAVKNDWTTGDVVVAAIYHTYPVDVREAREELGMEQVKPKKGANRAARKN